MTDDRARSRSSRPVVAFLGLGTMGRAMARRLLRHDFAVRAWNRTRARAEELAHEGAFVAATPAEAARGADLAVTMLADPAAVEAVVLGEAGVLSGLGLAPGAVLADMSTVDPATSRRLADAAAARGVRFVDAPVYGSRGPAEEGTLVVLAGGEAADVKRLQPVFAVLAKRVFHAGPVGAGSALKLAVNLAGSHVLSGIAAGLRLAEAAGIEGSTFLDALDAGAFGSPLVQLKGRKMLARDFAPAFTVDLTVKDLDLAIATARETGTRLPTAEALLAAFREAQARGLGALDLSALYLSLATDPAPRREAPTSSPEPRAKAGRETAG